MATWAGKYQILHREFGLTRAAPTTLEVDASAATHGVAMERVSRQKRFRAASLAMLRQWCGGNTLTLLKTDTKDMRAEILSKPVSPGCEFREKKRLLLTDSKQATPGIPHGR
jgi:hypothetical protein